MKPTVRLKVFSRTSFALGGVSSARWAHRVWERLGKPPDGAIGAEAGGPVDAPLAAEAGRFPAEVTVSTCQDTPT
jgi:hypothetical protein